MALKVGFARWPVSLQAIALQLAVLPATWLVAIWLGDGAQALPLALLQGGLAATASAGVGMPRWWWLIQLGFWPLLVLALAAELSPVFAAIAFLVLLLVYGGGVRNRVPLYLSSEHTLGALLARLPGGRPIRFLDLGAGLGGLLSKVQHARPDWRCEGVERAWLPWLAGWMRLKLSGSSAQLACRDFFTLDWGQYDVIYAFLSPAPMAEVWQKACTEMQPGSIFVSNSFEVPGVPPDEVIETGGWHRSRLLIWYR